MPGSGGQREPPPFVAPNLVGRFHPVSTTKLQQFPAIIEDMKEAPPKETATQGRSSGDGRTNNGQARSDPSRDCDAGDLARSETGAAGLSKLSR